ncbi:helix-turn-helix transcriptional regulator [Methylomonas montana]|uniref:helix-turn-helix transcriptional regulator n=1 Tax=Methylomonas montana TaxID=3058963 RepID=UPI0026580E09|nr:helix-turn-helix transcriptional regulator [Methylomonas montana]WKJ90060.1 helix-turn-helix transcriptional regulator [Methylomonas montana]
MKPNHALAYLRQICCSGLSREIAIAEFLRAVPLLIPSNSNTFSVSDLQLRPNYHLAGFDVGDMAGIIHSITEDFNTPARTKRAANWFSQHKAVRDPKIIEASFYLTDFYNLIFRQFDMHHVLWVRIPLNAENSGVLGLYRPANQKPFDSHDQTQLTRLMPYVFHAYHAANEVDFEPSPDGTSGMIIMNPQGDMLYQSPEAKLLLREARFPRLLTDQRAEDRLQAKLAELCRNLCSISRGQEAPPPSFTHAGSNGQFQFRAYWLEGCQRQPGGLIGILIEHREPLVLKVLRGMRDLPLSPAQRDVTLLLARGLTPEQICSCLHIKPSTLKDHIGKIYQKLDIHQREELLPKLLASNT